MLLGSLGKRPVRVTYDQPMAEKDRRDTPRSRRRTLLANLGKMARPPLTTPQWKDALREQEARGRGRKER
jgi:hypothetical protein